MLLAWPSQLQWGLLLQALHLPPATLDKVRISPAPFGSQITTLTCKGQSAPISWLLRRSPWGGPRTKKWTCTLPEKHQERDRAADQHIPTGRAYIERNVITTGTKLGAI